MREIGGKGRKKFDSMLHSKVGGHLLYRTLTGKKIKKWDDIV
jgi:hypothetical protein